jgi:hypothetical protein
LQFYKIAIKDEDAAAFEGCAKGLVAKLLPQFCCSPVGAQGIGGARSVPEAKRREWSDSGTPQSPVFARRARKNAPKV